MASEKRPSNLSEEEYQPPVSLVVNKKTDHFFISIVKKEGHSFIMLGVYDNTRIRHVLCRVGKKLDCGPKKDAGYCHDISMLGKALFSAADAFIQDEGVSREKAGHFPITYQAYDITYDQYLEFVSVLESLKNHDSYKCYKPELSYDDEEAQKSHIPSSSDEEMDPDTVQLKLSEEKKLNAVDVSQLNHLNKLNLGNTCRHSAIKLVEDVLHAPVPSSVSSFFLMNLPCETLLEYGCPSKKRNFYVLPPPPACFHESDAAKEKVLMKLYSRMEDMLLLEPESPSTQKKFLKLKELYLKIEGPDKNLTLDQLLLSIHDWKNTNESTLKVLRKEYIWDSLSFIKRESSTMKLFAEIEDYLDKESTKRRQSTIM
ncbi:Uncharacterised protein [Legionella wadsworthii]|uniref:Uncharacterized protein n=1 Tax=Legionella wadsworthii TaxID=28088 RepID=A0A378LRP6_9GAMM|nr:hypothetical protein [Legionella wadsworthii]STY29606.1 Uncharacterised protein [Legionella wadsworthii]